MSNPARVTAKDFFLWFAAMASLYGGIIAFVSLIFDYINTAFPNPVRESYYYDSYSSSISYETASLIVLTPVFMLLMRIIRRSIADDPTRNEIWVRRWAIVLTLFLAGAAMVIDLIVALTTYLQGEDVTVAFLLKVLTVLLVAGALFAHFLADLRGYWQREQSRARMLNWAVGVLALATIIAGFFISGTPQDIRREKQDNLRVQDLQSIQWQIVNFWQQKERLPESMEDLRDPISGYSIPTDPETKESYEYRKTGDRSFELCAVFATEGGQLNGEYSMARPVLDPTSANDTWEHGVGRTCFERTIDPERYPVYEKPIR